jgi:LPS sulfotransferase NodH
MKTLREKIRRLIKGIFRPLQGLLANKDRTNVAMIHVGRCGSTVLAKMLNAHEKVYWSGEFYNRFFPGRNFPQRSGNTPVEFPGDPIELLQEKMSSLKAFRADVFGFEIKPFHYGLMQIPFGEYVESLEAAGFTHFIVLDRKNRLRKMVSSVIAQQPGNKYHIANNEKAKRSLALVDVGSVKIDSDDKPLLSFLEDYDEQFFEVAKVLSDRNVLQLSYEEDIQEDPRQAYTKVCEFIGLPQQTNIEVRLNRTNPYPLSELIENYDEVAAALQGTPYEWMLEG